MAAHYLDFERPIADLEAKIDELSRLSASAGGGAGGFDSEIDSLRARVDTMRREAYAKLDTWQKIQVARHPERPHCVNYIDALIDDYVELRGDRRFGDDQAIIGGLGRFRGMPVVVLGNEKGHDTTTRIKHNFGLARPEGYRKAVRLMDMADQFNLPVITFGDTAGAYPGLGAEERGQGEAIARATERCLTLGVPMISTIIGEGGSGGVLAIISANKVMILEHAVFSVASPEAGASILFRDRAEAPRLAKAWKMTAQELYGFKIVDRIIEEPVGGAHSDPDLAITRTGDAVEEELKALMSLTPEALRKQRADRFYAIGRQGLA